MHDIKKIYQFIYLILLDSRMFGSVHRNSLHFVNPFASNDFVNPFASNDNPFASNPKYWLNTIIVVIALKSSRFLPVGFHYFVRWRIKLQRSIISFLLFSEKFVIPSACFWLVCNVGCNMRVGNWSYRE